MRTPIWPARALAIAIPAGAVAAALMMSPATGVQAQEDGSAEDARGKYLVTVMGCADCRTPHDEQGRPIEALALSGHQAGVPLAEWAPSLLKRNILDTISPTLTSFAGPFGVSVAGNLTPDKVAGIGMKTADELVSSWRTGQHWRRKGMMLPPMPMDAYKALTDQDIRAIHAYLMTVKPIRNVSPGSKPAPAASAAE